MAADTLIKEDFCPRRVAGALFVFLGLPVSLIFIRFGMSNIESLGDALILAVGPLMVAGGLWLAFPRRRPRVKLRITDDRIDIPLQGTSIPLADLTQISLRKPLGGKHDVLEISTGATDVACDVAQLSHEARDIINLISMRLEEQGRYLQEGRTDVLGAPNQIWAVQDGAAFEKSPQRAKIAYGAEQDTPHTAKRG